jgi:hypothetical protein
MSPNLLEAADATIQYLQFSTSLFLIILTANGIAFFYYWTTKLGKIKAKCLYALFGIPAGIVLIAFIFIGITYSRLIDSLAAGIPSKYVEFWFDWSGLILWLPLVLSIISLAFALIMVNKKVMNK